MKRAKRNALRVVKKTFGSNSKVEQSMRNVYRSASARAADGRDTKVERFVKSGNIKLRGAKGNSFSTESFTVMWSKKLEDENRFGIYAKGSCDLPSVFAAAPQIQSEIDGTCAVYLERGGGSAVRSDILLQTLNQPPKELMKEVSDELSLPPGYFEPNLFKPTFRLPGYGYLGDFPKRAVVISMASDVARTVYRHRESGLLVDPGGWWLNQDMSQVLSSLDKVNWFRNNFEKLGKMPVEQFYDNYTEIITTLKNQTTDNILVLNLLEVEPGDPTHTYQLVSKPGTKRRREFNLALLELSRKLDFNIVDVDKILKKRGVESQVDFAHFTHDGFKPLADEIFGIFRDLNVLSS